MVNQKVRLKDDKIGTVKETFTNLVGDKVLIVKLGDGTLIKCYELEVEYIKDEPEEENKTVLIDYDSFTTLIAKKALEVSKKDRTIGILLTLFGDLLAKDLFGVKADND